MLKKSLSVFFLLFFSGAALSAGKALREIDLNTLKPSWQAVIGGQAVAQVAETSYGFACVSDGRLVSTCTYSGNVMWQKGVKGKPSKFFSSWGDFIYSVSNKSVLNFINPSGVTVWSADCGYEITHPPLTGWDGRIFVQGDKNISCYGIKGRLKWTLKIPHINDLPLSFLSDGSLLIFLSKSNGGKTTGLRISPFGEVLEEITFAGEIIYSQSCPQGVLMSFSDGSAGLCSVENDSAVSKWVYKNQGKSRVNALICSEYESALLFNTGTDFYVDILENETGKPLNSFAAPYINTNDIKYLRKSEQGFFVCDSKTAVEFNKDGAVFFKASLPSKDKWNYIKYTDNSQILLCMKNWVLNAYVMNQTTSSAKIKKSSDRQYVKPSKINQKYDGIAWSSIPLSRVEEIKSALKKGNYPVAEKQYLSELMEMSGDWKEELSSGARSRREKISFYEDNPIYTQTLLECLSQVQTDTFTEDIASLLRLESDPLLLNALIAAAGQTAYDKNGEILKSFEVLTKSRNCSKDTKTAFLICDAAYSIVAFMGRPALYRQGKQLLSHFMYPQYSKEIREYARDTLTKIISLEL